MSQNPCRAIDVAPEPPRGLRIVQQIRSRINSSGRTRSWLTALGGIAFLVVLCLLIGAVPLEAGVNGVRSVKEDLDLIWEEMDLDQLRLDSRCLKAISLFTILAGACIAVLQASTTSRRARYVSVALGVLITASVTTQDTFFRTDFWTLDYVLEDAEATVADFKFEWKDKDLDDSQLRNKYRMELIRLRQKLREIKNRTRSKQAEIRTAQNDGAGGWERIFLRYAYAEEAPRQDVVPEWYGQPAAKGSKISVASYGFDRDLERSLGNARILGQLLFLERLHQSIAEEMAHRQFEDPAAQAFEVTRRVMDVLGPYWNESVEKKDFQLVAEPPGGKGYQTFLRTGVDIELLSDIFVEFTDGVIEDPATAKAIFGKVAGALTQPMIFPLGDPVRDDGQKLDFDAAVDLFRQGRLEEALAWVRRGLQTAEGRGIEH